MTRVTIIRINNNRVPVLIQCITSFHFAAKLICLQPEPQSNFKSKILIYFNFSYLTAKYYRFDFTAFYQ